jgi:hypothetical protein
MDHSADLEREEVYFPQEMARNTVTEKTNESHIYKVNLHSVWISLRAFNKIFGISDSQVRHSYIFSFTITLAVP